MNRCDCLFVFPPGGDYELEMFSYTIGSGYVIAFLRSWGVSAGQFDCSESLSAAECAARILRHAPRIVGFTVFNTNFISCLLIAEKIKQFSPRTVVVFGGPTASTYARFIVGRYACVDICVRNEGEETFHALYTRLAASAFKVADAFLEGTRSLTYRQDGRIRHTPDADILLENHHNPHYLDNYPSPYLTGVIPAERVRTVGMVTARGCNQNCVFCNCAVLSKRRFSLHSVGRVLAEIDYLSRHLRDHELLNIFDDAFTLLPARAKTICRGIIDAGIKVKLGCITRCDCVDEEMLDLMKAAGFVSLGFSLESAVPRILRIIGKVRPAEDVPSDGLEAEERFIGKLEKAAAYAKAIGIRTIYASIMVGLPTETVEEARQTVTAINSIAGIDTYTHNLLAIYRGTPLYLNYRKYGYRIHRVAGVPVFEKTRHPVNVAEGVQATGKSQISRRGKQYDRNAVRILALLSQRSVAQPFFDNVVMLSNTVTRDIIEWLTESLAINGFILHLYSSRARYVANYAKNDSMFYKHLAPSLNVHSYYVAQPGSGMEIRTWYSQVLTEEDGGAGIRMAGAAGLLGEYRENGGGNMRKAIGREDSAEDCRALLGILKMLANQKGAFDHLWGSRAMPYFAGLCRWTGGGANCETLETAIVDDKGEIRLCWTGTPVGRVGDAFADIRQKAHETKEKVRKARNCRGCSEEKNCMKCMTPAPLSSLEYCRAMQDGGIATSGELLRSFQYLGDFLAT